MKAIYIRFKVLWIYLQLVKDPNRTEKIIQMVRMISRDDEHPALRIVLEQALRHAGFRGALEDRRLPRVPLREDVALLPAGTLGQALFDHMEKNHLSWDLFPHELAGGGRAQYLAARMMQVHDVWHALLGYGISIGDELALQAFTYAQTRSGISMILISGGLLHTLLFSPMELSETFEEVIAGFQRGKRAGFLLDHPLEEMLALPLDQARALCGLTSAGDPLEYFCVATDLG